MPEGWRGALPITYRVGPSAPMVHLMVKSEWSLKTIYDVVATMKGSDYPDEWVLRGNHHDGWVHGAADPLSGQVALLEEARVLGELAKTGWKPKRTIVYLSWDAEEPALLGSTEWAEEHAAELKQKAVLYINTDGNERGFLGVEGSHDLEHFVNEVANDVTDPETHATVAARARAKIRMEALSPSSHDPEVVARLKEQAKLAADPSKDFPIGALGSGSDYSAFIEHLGIPALNVAYGDEGKNGGIYHSRYDTWEHYTRFEDPGFVYEATLAKTVGRMVLRASGSDLPIQHTANFASTVETYVKEVKKLADTKREAAETQAGMLKDRVFALTADPTKSSGDPTALKAVPKIDFAPLDAAVTRLKASAKAYDDALRRACRERSRRMRKRSCADDADARPDARARRCRPAGAAVVQEPDLRPRPLHRLWRQDPARRARSHRGRTLRRCRQIFEADRRRAQRLQRPARSGDGGAEREIDPNCHSRPSRADSDSVSALREGKGIQLRRAPPIQKVGFPSLASLRDARRE